MEENIIDKVYVTPCGKKFHSNSECIYIRTKPKIQINYNQAIQEFEGPCSRCFGYNHPLFNKNNLIINKKIKKNNLFYNKNKNFFSYKNININSNNIKNNNYFSNNNKNIYNNEINFKKLNKVNFNIVNRNVEEDKKENEIKEENILDKKEKISDFLVLSGSDTIVAGGGILIRKTVQILEEKSSDIDFNNNKFSTKNKKFPELLNNKNVINYYDISSEIKNLFENINKSSKNKEDENILKKIIEKKNDNKINEKKIINLINKNEVRNNNSQGNELFENDSNNFNIINNPSYNKNNIYKKENELIINNNKVDNEFFSNNQSNSNNLNKNNNIIIYNIENFSQNITKTINFNNNEKKLFSISSNKKLKNKKKKNFFINENDMKILIDTNENSKSFILNDNFKFNEIKNDIFNNGKFKFSFNINPKIINKINIKIEVGFEINYCDENDISINDSSNNSSSENEESILDSEFEKIIISRKFNIYKKTNNINVLININEGKFFIVGNNAFNKINNKELLLSKNCDIFYLSNFQKISLQQFRKIKPIFKFKKEELNIVEIIINGKKIENNCL